MHSVPTRKPIFETKGLLFHVATLSDGIPDGPRGVFISNDFVEGNPTLREVVREDVAFYFKAIDPLLGIPENAPFRAIKKVTDQRPMGSEKLGNDVAIEVYAEWTGDVDRTKALLEDAIHSGEDSLELKAIVHKILSEGFVLSCEFIDNLRRALKQYWLTSPNELTWFNVCIFHVRETNFFR